MSFETALRSGGLLLDGGLGTALIARGLPIGVPPDLWNLERPEVLTDVHRSYVEAGSDAIHANTFGANPLRLGAFGLADRCEELNRAAVACARAARPRYVIADIGPTGEYLPPVGHADSEQWRAAFESQARALAGTDIDAFHIETMTDLREAMIALEALRSIAPSIPVLASMTFERKKRGFFTIMGNALVESLNALWSAGAIAVGANCSITSRDMRELTAELVRSIPAPIVAQPNAGSPEMLADGTYGYGQSAEEFASDMAEIAAAGVAAVGGCCGTDASFIRALSVRLEKEGV